MQLKYVGAMPMVSDKGVAFDQSRQDKYTLLGAVVELLEALSYGPTEVTKHLHTIHEKVYSSQELLSLLKQHCKEIEEVIASAEAKADKLVEELITRVKENETLSEDARTAWLNNIELMKEYYHQYVINESAYQCALEALGEEIHEARVLEVSFPLFKNYGLVLHDLDAVLQGRKSPIDTVLNIEMGQDSPFGKLTITHR